MFFSFLNYLPKEEQTKIIDSWVKMRKDYEIKQKKQKKQEEIMEYIRKNPPQTFRDMMVVGPFISEYYRNKTNLYDKTT